MQEIVHTLLFKLEEYGVSKEWIIITDTRWDLNLASTPSESETGGPSAQHRYCDHERSLGGGAKKKRGNGEE